ncbi:MAG: DNA-directed RNA polymerase subunit omega [Firmicutes bacterium]|nr:DNA-directed RNA polymerase subunit omega [Bacillota bacterium]
MLIYPSIDSLMEKVDSKYVLVVIAAKRARELQDMKPDNEGGSKKKPVTQALEEVDAGIITYQRERAS